ncbi:hypothetical protein GCM10007086_33190 [Photobacterium aphoticum]|uniref:DUF4405 domain-containing protein n=2 Tax=Photobacterium aphoticum TaxID=754436 RepID=A0A0J1GK94_9GAMM|nr:hypothetical protein ABT58_14335 [Photobacterium aphoticum]PSU57177.1 hypothetical protein C9I90_10280 [Photobacterium aphoticum]GHA56491.1 hypothetical protein GCM10007086_33190 [Photobacterium aphoticum]
MTLMIPMNTQKLATSITIGLFAVSAFTGLLLFFELSTGGVRATHEWMSMGLMVAVGCHAYTHKKVFVKYFSQKLRMPMLVGLVAGVGLFALSFNDNYAAGEMFDAAVDAKLVSVAGVFGVTEQDAQTALEAAGLTVNSDQTLSDIAEHNNADVYDVIDVLVAMKHASR